MNELHEQYRITDTHFFFWNTPYSQWHSSEFEEDGIVYENAEKYMMVQKAKLFDDNEIVEKMLRTTNPKTVKSLGRQVKNFSDSIWIENRMKIVERGNYLKFTQNPKILEFMKKHKDLILVEASPHDKIWGIGIHFNDERVLNEKNWKGLNLLGKALMTVRDEII